MTLRPFGDTTEDGASSEGPAVWSLSRSFQPALITQWSRSPPPSQNQAKGTCQGEQAHCSLSGLQTTQCHGTYTQQGRDAAPKLLPPLSETNHEEPLCGTAVFFRLGHKRNQNTRHLGSASVHTPALCTPTPRSRTFAVSVQDIQGCNEELVGILLLVPCQVSRMRPHQMQQLVWDVGGPVP